MKYRKLGKTGFRVSEIGFGAWGIGGEMWKGGDDSTALAALHEAAEQGINFFDTALAYGKGHSEILIGRLLRETKQTIKVATKVPPRNKRWPSSGTLTEAFPAQHIIDCAHESLRNLGVERIDLLQLHVWNETWFEGSDWQDALGRLKRDGKISSCGVSIDDHRPDSALPLVRSGLIDTVQVIYNIFDQSPVDRLFPACLENQVGVIVRVPFDEGALTGKMSPDTHFSRRDWRSRYFRDDRKQQVVDRVESLLKDLGADSSQLPAIALRFCLAQEAVSTVIPGMRTLEHVRSNAEVSNEPLLMEQMLAVLRQHSWQKNFYS